MNNLAHNGTSHQPDMTAGQWLDYWHNAITHNLNAALSCHHLPNASLFLTAFYELGDMWIAWHRSHYS